jgi:hypothetical protein
MQALETLKKPWGWITINFIRPLPELKGYNYLMIVTNRLIKFIHLILIIIIMTASQLASLLIGYIIINHRIPQYIILDRDKLFILKF